MGQPKKQRRKYSTPKHLFKGREGETELIRGYGLKNAKELWKAKSEISRIRGLARKLLADRSEKAESDLMGFVKKLGILNKDGKLEDVLAISVESLLDRRLQTIVYKRGLTTSVKGARQEIAHGHIAVDGKRMNSPGHLLTLEEGEKVDYYGNSPLANPEHVLRKVERVGENKIEIIKIEKEDKKRRGRGGPGGQRGPGGPRGPGGYRPGGSRGPGGSGGYRGPSGPRGSSAPNSPAPAAKA